jgi:Fe-S-cluster-containing dehydrogenase component
MAIDRTIFIDSARCIGCRACEAACRECDTHKGESMIMVDFVDRGSSVATQPTVCMHCEDPVAPCAQVCPAVAIMITDDGVVHQADPSRCIGCKNCVYACPFGVPKFDPEARLMKKCNLCYDRTVQGYDPWCTTACPTDAIWFGTDEEFHNRRKGFSTNRTRFGEQSVRTRVNFILPEGNEELDVVGMLQAAALGGNVREEAWVL